MAKILNWPMTEGSRPYQRQRLLQTALDHRLRDTQIAQGKCNIAIYIGIKQLVIRFLKYQYQPLA
jgi:hypothetical protein